MLSAVTTSFIGRLRDNDQAAWFELWETFGPVVRLQLTRWGKGRIGAETVRDLSQETLAALSDSIERYDPARGARFSTWLLAIAKHVLGDEIDRRMAQKRGSGKKAVALDERWATVPSTVGADAAYEAAVFRAKIEAALRAVEREAEFMDFSIYRMRVLDGLSGRDVAAQLGVSEPTVSRRLAKVRGMVRDRARMMVEQFSFTADELGEAARNGLDFNPTKADDDLFDEAICEIYHRQAELRRLDEQAAVED
ncbi:MAG: sigma-70 family RNA polymerase sigma factor [Planctomycetota bacterium]